MFEKLRSHIAQLKPFIRGFGCIRGMLSYASYKCLTRISGATEIMGNLQQYAAYLYLEKIYKNSSKLPLYVLKHPANAIKPGEMIYWICWFQGLENAPDLVKACFNSVKKFNSGNRIILITYNNLNDYITLPDFIIEKHRQWTTAKKEGISPAHFSDIIRVYLLCVYGGVWLDSTVLLTAPIPDNLLSQKLFFFRKSLLNTGLCPISNWFIIASSQSVPNPLLFKVLFFLFHYWETHNQLVKIVFDNFWGSGYGCSPKYIAQYIIKQTNEFKLIWLIDKKKNADFSSFPRNIKIVKYGSFSALFHLSTARFWVDNCRKSFYPPKRKGQIYIQTWHGNFPMKKIEADAPNLPKGYIENAKKDSENTDYIISSYHGTTHIYRNSFWYTGEILEIGSPRMDIFFEDNEDVKKKTRNKLNVSDKTKIVLYSPTFRNSDDFIYGFNYDDAFITLKDFFCANDICILVRLHPNRSSQLDNKIYFNQIKNVSHYPDIQELLLITDMLISDYSSVSFDYIFTGHPIFLYAPDYNDYLISDREFYNRLEDLPFPLARTELELFNNIRFFDLRLYREKLDNFFKKYNYYKIPNSCQKVYQLFME